MVTYFLYRLVGWLAPRIPARLGYWLFARIGDLFYWLDADGRRAVHDNLQHVLGPDVPRSVLSDKVRATFHTQAYNYFDLFRVPSMSAEEIEARVNVEGWGHLEAAVAQGKGLIVVSAHFGNTDVLLQVLGIRGVKALLLMEHLRPERLFKYVANIRAHSGTEIIPVDAPLKRVFRALRAGEVVPLALDRDVTHSGVDVPFFGEPARLPYGYARLARHTGSPIILAFGLRLLDHQLRLRIEPALEVPQTDDRASDVRAIMRQALDIAERYIAEHPEQWVMFRPIWQSCD
ncbi:MAG: lysophospholipid acyltransferase family protein [Anaerolineae bacterium]